MYEFRLVSNLREFPTFNSFAGINLSTKKCGNDIVLKSNISDSTKIELIIKNMAKIYFNLK